MIVINSIGSVLMLDVAGSICLIQYNEMPIYKNHIDHFFMWICSVPWRVYRVCPLVISPVHNRNTTPPAYIKYRIIGLEKFP